MPFQLRPATDDDLSMLRRWRNQPKVRDVSFNRHEISEEEHRNWWKSVRDDPTRRVYVFHDGERDLGVVTIYDLNEQDRTCWWGFHLGDEESIKGHSPLDLWISIEEATIDLVFNRLGCRELYSETLARNEMVLDLHRRFGCEEVRRETRKFADREEEVVVMVLRRQPARRLLILGSANWDAAARQLEDEWPALANEPLRVTVPPFNQYRILLNDPDSILYRHEHDLILVAERFEDFLPRPFSFLDRAERKAVEERFDAWLHVLREIRARLSGFIHVMEMAPVISLEDTLTEDGTNEQDALAFVARLNAKLAATVDDLPDASIIRTRRCVEEVGRENANPGKYFQLGRIAYAAPMISVLGRHLAGHDLARRGLTVRVLAFDLDNTVWGGVIGDDGIGGIALGNDHPGNVFVAVQEALKKLTERGIVLAICSKNTEEVALQAFREHPGMVLKPEDIASWRINWQPKPQNLLELAEEMSLGLGSFCFLDDNPHEREAMRQALPEVHVIDWPEDISELPELLLKHPRLQAIRITESDRKRTKSYQARRLVEQARSLAASREEFLQSLGLKLFIERYDDKSRQRVLQLLAKTNQFNMTTRRHGEQDLQRLQAAGAEIYTLSAEDRFTEREIVGVMILVPEGDALVIETFLMSCRAIGRDLEVCAVAFAAARARERGCKSLLGEFVPTPRNAPAAELYPRLGFRKVERGYLLDLAKGAPECPAYIELEANA